MTEPKYEKPEAFKHSLETRLRMAADNTGV